MKDQVAIITGATRGIGRAVAEEFAAQGATIVVVATRQEQCEAAAKELADKHGVPAIGVATDVSSSEAVQALVKTVVDTYGKVDILVNNAGITKDNLMLRMSEDDWDDVIRINLKSIFLLTKAVIRPMLKKKFGRIINMSSVVGVMGNAGQANYAASKAGMIGFTKSIARELGAKNITCNAIAPGFIETDMIESLPKEYLDNIIDQVPQKRLGQATEVAKAAAFLADEASYTTGQVIHVDGGMQM